VQNGCSFEHVHLMHDEIRQTKRAAKISVRLR
jgi:hypothetical protein